MLLSGLREYDDISVGTIMSMADDGWSTWRMRKDLDMPAFGWDFRDALVGLAENESLAKIFLHRFQQWEELRGHSVGNIILLGLFEACDGDIPKALDIAHEVLRVRWKVYPSTVENINLRCTYDDGTILDSQYLIDNSREMWWHHIVHTELIPSPKAFQKALDIIWVADKIVLWPWDFYANTVANILVEGVADAIKASSAKKVFVVNLMTKYNQTHGFTASMFVEELKKYLGIYPDYVIVNNDFHPQHIDVDQYASEKREMVEDDLETTAQYMVIKDKVWREWKEFKRVKSDVVPRSFIRHNPKKLAEIIVSL